jgi:diguanylate cyclase (GGDEF)-like protein
MREINSRNRVLQCRVRSPLPEMEFTVAADRDPINEEIDKLRLSSFSGLKFSTLLEEQFENSSAKRRSHRLWIEVLIAILALNGCLLFDYLLLKDMAWGSAVLRTMVATPLALMVLAIVGEDPKRWIREGSVTLAMVLICFINLYSEGNDTAARVAFGLICALIMALFTNVTLRVRFEYAAVATGVMLAAGLWFVHNAGGLTEQEKTIGASLITIGFTITLAAGYSLEREERMSYLLFERSRLQGEELHRISSLDKLTELPNRRAFEEGFESLWVEGMRTGTSLSAVVIDIDHFKVVNDVYGHLYGDEVLRRVASLLPQGLRGQQDLAARFGGEEFVILLPDAGYETAHSVAERVRSLVEMAGTPVSDPHSGKQMLWVTVSCGVSTCVPNGALSRERLLKSADRALYNAKEGGRNRVAFKVCEAASSPNIRAVEPRDLGIRRFRGVRGNRESGSHPIAPR